MANRPGVTGMRRVPGSRAPVGGALSVGWKLSQLSDGVVAV